MLAHLPSMSLENSVSFRFLPLGEYHNQIRTEDFALATGNSNDIFK
jgi:hypothetical protein